MIKSFFRYYSQAITRYQIHSTFVFDWATEALDDDRQYYAFDKAEQMRFMMEQNENTIEVTDFGAGSRVANGSARKVSAIAKSAVTPMRQCEVLFKTIQYFKPKTMLEIGTSLGVAAAYQAAGYTKGQLWTLEGCPNIARIAQQNLMKANVKNTKIVVGEFSKTLPDVLQEIAVLDYVFIDGNHRLEPTLQYFEACLKHAHNDTLFVFDDIHWSAEMEEAWERVKKHPQVTLTIDLFYMGLVWIRKENTTIAHLTAIETWQKPWLKFGLF
jgi:predicted O-methyltransferase YrrM